MTNKDRLELQLELQRRLLWLRQRDRLEWRQLARLRERLVARLCWLLRDRMWNWLVARLDKLSADRYV